MTDKRLDENLSHISQSLERIAKALESIEAHGLKFWNRE